MIKMMEVQSMLQHFVDLRAWKGYTENCLQETQTALPHSSSEEQGRRLSEYLCHEGRKVGICRA
jgi:hypothetical protein